MPRKRTGRDSRAEIVCPEASLTVMLVRDNGRIMARCVELDLVTEMDTPQAALRAMLELMREYAEDYREREDVFLASSNRAPHKPHVDRVLACRDEWELRECLEVRHAHVHVPPGAKRLAATWV